MELRDYVKIIGKRFWLLLLTIIIFTVGSYVFTVSTPQSFDGSVSIYISKKTDVNDAKDYQYDQYYAIQASSLYADSIVTWLQDPSNVVDIYSQANIDLPTKAVSKLSKTIKATKKQPATITITMSAPNETTVRNLLNTTVNFLNVKATAANNDYNDFNVSYSNPTILVHQNSILLNSVIGFLIGSVLGLLLVFSVEYFSKK